MMRWDLKRAGQRWDAEFRGPVLNTANRFRILQLIMADLTGGKPDRALGKQRDNDNQPIGRGVVADQGLNLTTMRTITQGVTSDCLPGVRGVDDHRSRLRSCA